ncbi:MAG: HAMP domain-containing histidine kinase [Rhizobiales bacterium]|nr:HAMP domain-containing histidine kinase [Hyphomicrobiales bacterium]
MIVMTMVAFVFMYFGWTLYYIYLYDLIYPGDLSEGWNTGDFVVDGLIVVTGLAAAIVVGARIARNIVRPVDSVAEAVSLIAKGDFTARAETSETTFREARDLVTDFNAMAARLERAEWELRYSHSAIAHELRTPLTILRGRLQGLSDGVFAPTPVDDLSRIVEDLRTLALSEAGRLELTLGEFDLAEEAEAVITSVEPDLTGAGIAVKRQLGRALVVADRARMRQAMFAVLDNVRRYAPGSTLVLETRSKGNRALILCTDTGPGLPPGLKDRVFEPFWRGEESRARSSGGSGLGLSIIRAIAEAHGGGASVAGRDGDKGTSIEIWVPSAASR